MSDAGERRRRTDRIVARRVKTARHFDIPWPKGRFRQRKPFDCGHTRCFLCHSEKVARIEKRKHQAEVYEWETT